MAYFRGRGSGRKRPSPITLRVKKFFGGGSARVSKAEAARIAGPRVVVIGGGTGLATLLRGLKEHTYNLTAVVTVADDGGGSGFLREDMGMLPPGDIRNCILALANTEPAMQSLLNHRFREGSLAGQSFGNLFLAAFNEIYGSFDKAVKSMSDVLAVTGRVLPVTDQDVRLHAVFADGSEVTGESRIYSHKKLHGCKISRVALSPERPAALPEALEAIRRAELIVLGPGSLYTSIIPNLLVEGVADAIRFSPALKLYVCNVMTQEGETEGYSAFDHAESLIRHGGRGLFDICLLNSSPIPWELAALYAGEGAGPVSIDRERFHSESIALAEYPLLAEAGNLARHDPARLAAAVMRVYSDYAGI